jgi:deoxyribonuclease V
MTSPRSGRIKDPEGLVREIEGLRWPRDRERIDGIQSLLNAKKKIEPLTRTPRLVAGVDSAFFGDKIISVACLYEYPGLACVEEIHVIREAGFPYIPGLLSFREGPAVFAAIAALSKRPDAVLFDGQGIAHPKGLGIASFVGVLAGIPSVGCAKSRLVGEYEEPGPKKGSRSVLTCMGRAVGAVLRTRNNTRPLFVSPGHLIDIEGSVELVLGCVGKYRLAEPVRRADMLTKSLKKDLSITPP